MRSNVQSFARDINPVAAILNDTLTLGLVRIIIPGSWLHYIPLLNYIMLYSYPCFDISNNNKKLYN